MSEILLIFATDLETNKLNKNNHGTNNQGHKKWDAI